MPLPHVISKDQTKAKHNQRWIIIHHYTDSQFREVITVSFALLESSPMVEINYRINTISYCGNTSKSDWVCGPCKQTNSYYKQRVVLKCTSCKQAPYVFRRRNTEWIQWGKDCHLYDAIQSCYIKRSSTMWTLTCKINRSQCQRFRSEFHKINTRKIIGLIVIYSKTPISWTISHWPQWEFSKWCPTTNFQLFPKYTHCFIINIIFIKRAGSWPHDTFE